METLSKSTAKNVRDVTIWLKVSAKVIREKSRGEGSLIEQDTIENVSEPKFFLKLFKKKNYIF